MPLNYSSATPAPSSSLLSLTLGSHSLTPPLTFTHTSESLTQLLLLSSKHGEAKMRADGVIHIAQWDTVHVDQRLQCKTKQNKTHEALEENL